MHLASHGVLDDVMELIAELIAGVNAD